MNVLEINVYGFQNIGGGSAFFHLPQGFPIVFDQETISQFVCIKGFISDL